MEVDDQGNPCIRLPFPHSNIIITPPQYSDGETVIRDFNDPRVYMNLLSPPFPYMREDWDERFQLISRASEVAIAEWKEVEAARKGSRGSRQREPKHWVGSALPMTAIREVDTESGGSKYLGSIDIRRRAFATILDEDERISVLNSNSSLKAGDPDIAWEFGFYLSPVAHGRGIMPAALGIVIRSFLVPYMNVRKLTGAYFHHNSASKRVFEKNGFVFEESINDLFEVQESKTGIKGQKVGLCVMRWEGITSASQNTREIVV